MRVTTLDESNARSESLYTRAFLLLLATQCSYGMSFSAFFLLPKYLKSELGASDLQIGAVGAVGAVTGVLAFPLVGALNDRHGYKRFMLLGSCLMTVSALSTLLLTRVDFAIYALRLLHGISFALLFNSATTLMAERVLPERLGVALGVFGSSMLITNALAPALSETLATRVGWPSVFWVSGAWGVLSMLLGLLIDEPRCDRRTLVSTAPSLLRERRTWVVALAISGAGAGFGTVFTFHQPYALSLGMTTVSGFFVAYAFAALFGRMLILSRIDHYDRRTVSAVSMLVYAAAVAGAAWLRPVMLECIGLVLGLAHGVLYPVFNALAIHGVRPAQRGSMMALYHGGFNGGMAVALLVGGSVVEALGYRILFWLTGAATAGAALYLARSPELRDARHHIDA